MSGKAVRGRSTKAPVGARPAGLLVCLLLAFFTAWQGLAQAEAPSGGRVLELRFKGQLAVRGDAANMRARSRTALDRVGLMLAEIEATAVRPLVSGLSQAEVTDLASEARASSGAGTVNMANWYRVTVPPEGAERALGILRRSPLVAVAEKAPVALPPPTTPDFSNLQLHLDAAPTGTGLEPLAADSRTRGAGIRIVDLEYYWTGTHEDLQLPPSTDMGEGQYVQYTAFGDEHGTAVFGILVAKDNGFGVTGGVPDATMKGISPTESPGFGYNPAGALTFLASRLARGDVVLIEQQADGPGPGSSDYVPMEWNQASFDAIRQLGDLGVIVVETGANGGYDLDSPDMLGKFDRTIRDSDAILVGAGDSVTHAPLWFTSHGSRLDLQGYGNNIVTTGSVGDLQGAGPNERDIRYTNSFDGTSGAGPIVTSAVASVLSYLKAIGQPPITGNQMVSLLRGTGTPQPSPGSGQIGPLPDVQSAIGLIDDSLPSVSIGGPADQSSFDFDSDQSLDLDCRGGGPELESCLVVDHGPSGDASLVQGDQLPTDQPGTHTLTATAVNALGLTATSTVSYEVGPGCHSSGTRLASVESRGSRVRLSGAVDPSLAGATAKVLRNGRKVGSKKVATDGIIEVSVAAPRSKKARKTARYSLKVGSSSSKRMRASSAIRVLFRKPLPAAEQVRARLSGIRRKGSLTLKSVPLCGGSPSNRKVRHNRRGIFTVRLGFGPATQIFEIRKRGRRVYLPVVMPAARFVLADRASRLRPANPGRVR